MILAREKKQEQTLILICLSTPVLWVISLWIYISGYFFVLFWDWDLIANDNHEWNELSSRTSYQVRLSVKYHVNYAHRARECLANKVFAYKHFGMEYWISGLDYDVNVYSI